MAYKKLKATFCPPPVLSVEKLTSSLKIVSLCYLRRENKLTVYLINWNGLNRIVEENLFD
jgi:hypothetical protein